MPPKKIVKDGESYKLLFEYSEGYLFVISKDAKIVDVNDNVLEDFGYTREETLGKPIKDFIFPSSLKDVVKGLMVLLMGKKSRPTDGAVKKKDGSIVYFRTSGRPLPVEEDGKEIGYLIFAVNTTSLKKAEKALEDSERKNRNLIENIEIGIYSAKNGILLDTNPAMQKMFGYSADELKDIESWNLAVPEMREKIKAEIWKKAESNDPSPTEVECEKKDGERFFVEVRVSGANSNDTIVYGTVIDITKRKKHDKLILESEKKYRDLFENNADGIWVVGNDLKIDDVNEEMCEMLGYSKDDMLGKSIMDFYSNKGVEKEAKDNFSKVSGGEPVYVERKLITKSGQKIDVAMNTRRMDHQGYKVIESIRNITDIKRLKSKIDKLEKKEGARLTLNEKIVFYGITRWPDLSDQELSEKINVKRSTITAIKNKLKREDYFNVIRLPSFALLDCEIMAISKHKFDKENDVERKKPDKYFPELVYHISTEDDSIGMSIAEDFPKLREDMDRFYDEFESMGIIKDMEQTYIPLKTLNMIRCMDFSPLLKKIFGLKIGDYEHCRLNEEPRELTKKEKSILYYLIKYPDATDTFISKKAGTARVTVSNIKRFLLEKNYLKTIVVPNFKKLGDYLLIFTHAFIGSRDEKNIDFDLEDMKALPNIFIRIVGSKQFIDLGLYKDYGEFKGWLEKLNEIAEIRRTGKKPEYVIMPVDHLREMYINFADITKKLLAI